MYLIKKMHLVYLYRKLLDVNPCDACTVGNVKDH